VYDDPADIFVATFIGSPPMNLIRTDEAIVGFRPEQYLPVDAFGPDERPVSYPLLVDRVENLGADRLIYGSLQPPHPPVRVISRLPSMLSFAVRLGERRDFATRARDIRRFTPAGGRERAAP
ncbi:MAG: ABC transporter ATP-binding protein, partial [Casimicrobiaceae bacterium]